MRKFILFFLLFSTQMLSNGSVQEIFEYIYNNAVWGSKETISGGGSTFQATMKLRKILTELFQDLQITSILDAPCGDFNWMRHFDLTQYQYFGMDIVLDLIVKNKENYQADNIQFMFGDLIKDDLPCVDVIFCRDCLVHFSYNNVIKALKNFVRSGSKYLFTTTFLNRENYDIPTGKWRPLCLMSEPFHFPDPLVLIINEMNLNSSNKYTDKSIGVWLIKDLEDIINRL